jgi:hypothetical protein
MSNTRKATLSKVKATGDEPVFDLDAARARRLESSQEPLSFTFNGNEFTVPTPMEWDFRVSELLADGTISGALKLLLGDEQYAKLADSGPTMGDLLDLMTWLGETAAGSLGNS